MNDAGFPWNSGLVIEDIYKTDNYLIKFTGVKSKKAIIFFSGNGLYFPNTEEMFKETIIQKNRYEWENTAKSRVIQNYYEKIIFVRDIYKQWYVKGINQSVNSIDKVIQLLKENTKGYEVTVCGNSAGGYMAVAVGSRINADKIFTFSGQFSVEDQLKRPFGEAPYLQQFKDDEEKRRYFSLIPYVRAGKDNIYYFYPGNCQYDMEQSNLVKNYSVNKFRFSSDSHGNTVNKECYPYLLTFSADKLKWMAEFYKNQWIDKEEFSRRLLPGYVRLISKIRSTIKCLKIKLRGRLGL